jgi:hypothetical protein
MEQFSATQVVLLLNKVKGLLPAGYLAKYSYFPV